jgi:hypothetical protein
VILSENQLKKIIKRYLFKESASWGDTSKHLSRNASNSSDSNIKDIEGAAGSLEGIEFTSIPNSKVADVARKEHLAWESGKLKEKSKNAYALLKKYWDKLDGNSWPEGRWDPGKTPWSAAFISWCMKASGESFYDSAAHTTYATKALKNRLTLLKEPEKMINKEIHVLFLKGEAEPEIGDTMFYIRDGNFKSWISRGGGGNASHTDIYVGNNQGIGGNLSNSVSKATAMKKHEAIIKKIKVTGLTEKALADDQLKSET